MKVDILTLFPGMFENVLNESMLKIARKKKKVIIKARDLRSWASDRHRQADDKPYGGGAGMIMKVEPVYAALVSILGERKVKKLSGGGGITGGVKIVLLTPKGRCFNQKAAKKFSKSKHIIFICGHYEGVDERVRALVTDEISIGDYILTGGEIPAMVILDAVTRLVPGVLGAAASLECESFENNLLEYPQYTRPRDFAGMKVPEILLSGNHGAIRRWRKKESLRRTKETRGDLLWKK